MQESYLAHHGVKGQKWGIRRYQDSNGDLTEAGKKRYSGKNGFKRLRKDTAFSYVKEQNAKSKNIKTLSRLGRATMITTGAIVSGGAASQWNNAPGKTQAIRGVAGALAGAIGGEIAYRTAARSFTNSQTKKYVREIENDPEMMSWGENYLRSQGIRV